MTDKNADLSTLFDRMYDLPSLLTVGIMVIELGCLMIARGSDYHLLPYTFGLVPN